jgi:transketolase
VQYAGRVGLGPLTAILVDNASSTYHWPGGVERRFELEGWTWARVGGHDQDALEEALRVPANGSPRVVVAEVAKR